jgi:galactokinase
MDVSELRLQFIRRFGRQPRLFHAPGRINLIGEHTDYNDGYVMPFAIDRQTIVAAAGRLDRRVVVYSMNLDEQREFNLDELPHGGSGTWLDYVEGVARCLDSEYTRISGADLMIDSDVPLGAGLSSSAALEIAAATAFLGLSNIKMEPSEVALAAQRAEHEYVGTKSGIMDQYIAMFAQEAHCLLIDCRSLDARAIPIDLSQVTLMVCDSRVKHQLASSQYNRRREECEEGVRLLSAFVPGIRALRDVRPEVFFRFERELPEPMSRRCKHVITENARTIDAAKALVERRFEDVGRLMSASHESLRHDYEVSCLELDVLVDAASRTGCALGSRMTGGGFGGCTINLLRPSAGAEFTRQVGDAYTAATGRKALIYPVIPSAGAGELTRSAA